MAIQTGRGISERADRVGGGHSSLARDLRSIAKRIDEARRGARSRLARRWELNLGFSLPIKRHDTLQQERQLDSQFQIRLARSCGPLCLRIQCRRTKK